MKRLRRISAWCAFFLCLAVTRFAAADFLHLEVKAKQELAVCHIPPGNPDNARTVTVSIHALRVHLAHGDCCGPRQGELAAQTAAGNKIDSKTPLLSMSYKMPRGKVASNDVTITIEEQSPLKGAES